MPVALSRRSMLAAAAGLAGSAALGTPARAAAYRGPNVILIRFGGGVRPREVIAPETTHSPFLAGTLAGQGVLFPRMRISDSPATVTSHAQGTLYLLTGRYDSFIDRNTEIIGERLEPKEPTLFELLRAQFDVPAHQALIVNGEDRLGEDLLTYSSDPHYGVRYRSAVISLNQFKIRLLRRRIAQGESEERAQLATELARREGDESCSSVDLGPEIDDFWEGWEREYGTSGLTNPRGDRLLTTLALRAMAALKPRLMLVNYQDPDYVHWGNASHYARAITVIDEGLRQIVTAAAAEAAYRDNTVFVVVPDCGRDDNPLMAVPYQHHFNSRAAREIFALVVGPGVPKGVVVDRAVEQADIAPTIGGLMGFAVAKAEGRALEAVFA